MKCKIFWGKPMEAVDAFNKWAEGKSLTREVLIHEQIIYVPDDGNIQILLIIVYHPEDLYWDATEPNPVPPEQRIYHWNAEKQVSELVT